MITIFSRPSPVLKTGVAAVLQLQQASLLEVSKGIAVEQVLSAFVSECEKLTDVPAYLSFFLRDEKQKNSWHVVAPTLPPTYLDTIKNAEGSTDAVVKELFGIRYHSQYLADIASETKLASWHEKALLNGLRACWVTPVVGIDGEPIGTLACHTTRPALPTDEDIGILAVIAQTAMLVLDREQCSNVMSSARDRHRQIFNCATDFAILAADLKGRATDWNEGARRLLGWTEQEMLGFSIARIFTPEDIANGVPEKEMRKALTDGYAQNERWHVRKSGERFWGVGQMTPLKSNDGQTIGFVKILRDRTSEKLDVARKVAYAATLKSEVEKRTRERDRIWRNSLDLLLTIRTDGVVQAVNPAWTASLGYTVGELIGYSFQLLVHPDDIQATARAIDLASVGPLDHFEMRLRHKDGSYRRFAWRASPEDGLVYANGRDVTLERRQAEQLAQANEARLQLALDAGEMGVWEWNLHSKELVWLYGSAEVHGIAAQERPLPMPLETYLAYLHPDDRSALADIMMKALHNAENAQAEYRVIWPDGSIHWLEARGHMMLDERGAPVHMVGVSADITKRKQTELDLAFLADASAELAQVVEPQSTFEHLAYLAVPRFADWCTVDLCREDGTLERIAVAHADPEKVELARRLHHHSPVDQHVPRGAWSVIQSGQAEFVRAITPEMLAESVTEPARLSVAKELGLRSYIGVPLSVQGKTLGAVMFFTADSGRCYEPKDVTLVEDLAHRVAVAVERTNLYRALQHSNQAKSVFLATLSHELRNPLAALVNGLGLIKLVIDDKRRVSETLRLVTRQTTQLTRLVDDLMDVSRIATGKIILQKKAVDLVDILRDSVEISRPEVEARNHTLTMHVPKYSVELMADPARLTQVFSNLMSNAAKYTNPGGQIDVSLEMTPDAFIVHVRDTGIGIAPEMLEQVFGIFTQVAHPIQRSQGGLGIGLSLVQGLVALHGGHVEALSAGLGQGSEFIVKLPRNAFGAAQDAAQPAAPTVRDDFSLTRRKILVVDDNHDAAFTVGELLRALDQDVELTHDGLSAVTVVEATRPDVVLLDIGLPGIDGYETARRIRARSDSYRPVLIAITGWGQESDKTQAYQAGFDRHLLKPVEFSMLLEVLQDVEKIVSETCPPTT